MPNGIGPVPLESDILLCQFSVRFLPSRRPCETERVSYENRPGTVAAISSVDDGSVFSGGGSVNAYARNDDEGVGSIWYRRKLAVQVQATSNPIAEDNGNRCIERSCLARGGRRAYRERETERMMNAADGPTRASELERFSGPCPLLFLLEAGMAEVAGLLIARAKDASHC